MLLYHGSNITINNPQLVEQRHGLDFGPGFYLTTSEEQSARFSEIVVKRKKCGAATVSIYNFDMAAAEKTLAVRKFSGADIEWLQFVVENRLKMCRENNFDVVIGAVANDAVMPTIQAYISGFINEEATLITLKVSKLVDQICLKTEKALSLLNFIKSYEVNFTEGSTDG